ncbi:hypothetical protein L9F63_016757, partial [Diploptera punctata]
CGFLKTCLEPFLHLNILLSLLIECTKYPLHSLCCQYRELQRLTNGYMLRRNMLLFPLVSIFCKYIVSNVDIIVKISNLTLP